MSKISLIKLLFIIGITFSLIGFFVVFPDNDSLLHDLLQISVAIGSLCIAVGAIIYIRDKKSLKEKTKAA